MKHTAYKRKPLGNRRFIWKQKEFVLSTFNCVAADMDKMIKNCKEAGFNLPFWFYYQACGVYETEKFTFSMQRMMMYAAALYGAKGLQSYTATGVCHEPERVEEYPDKWTALLGTGEKGEN